MRAASVFYRGIFRVKNLLLPENVLYRKDLSSSKDQIHHQIVNIIDEKDMLCSEVQFNGQDYKNGDLIVLQVKSCDELTVGVIETIIVKYEEVHFVCRQYQCTRNWLQYFESQDIEQELIIVKGSEIVDYKPLIKRGSMNKFVFVLHHRISFEYL